MKFKPKTENELAKEGLYLPGEYDFEVMSADDKTSSKGNEMIELKLKVFGNNGAERHVYDFLMEKLSYKLRHFCETTGLLEKYEAGTLEAADCELRVGRVVLGVDSKNKDFPPKNVAKDYVGAVTKPQQQEFEDDIPF